ncbi:hypothetical protein [Alphaspiravirus yamagawaense]|uniref:Uncharacterized protein n=1 Tax=Alphaspiravirus yamagawaense TaxID=1157339 RepID=J7QC54_9VIRU|nr:hypothetical protein [Aeropyrum coil-shaped virus]CCG27814.1 hypothetical protein [Aeropyrum coil-shaped virus]
MGGLGLPFVAFINPCKPINRLVRGLGEKVLKTPCKQKPELCKNEEKVKILPAGGEEK